MTLIVEIALGIVLSVMLFALGSFLISMTVRVMDWMSDFSSRDKAFILVTICVALLAFGWLATQR